MESFIGKEIGPFRSILEMSQYYKDRFQFSQNIRDKTFL